MANLKISALPSGNPAQAGDILPVDRAGTNVGITATSIAALAAANGVQIPTAGTTSPSPVYSPNEAPSNMNTAFYVQDVNGDWHQQAGMDTVTADSAGSGPPDPAGTFTVVRRTYFRDDLLPEQGFKNSFVSMEHRAGYGTVQTNQDRTLGVSMSNVSETVNNYSISSGVITLQMSASPTHFKPNMPTVLSGFATSTFLNGVDLTIATAVGQTLTAPISHGDVGTTVEAGQLDQVLYSMACNQMELDINGAPQFLAEPDSELSALSVQVADNHNANETSPGFGVNCIRSTYFREEGAGIWGAPGVSNVKLDLVNASANDGESFFMSNLTIGAADVAACPHLGYIAINMTAPSPRFSGGNYGLNIGDWGANTSDYAVYVTGGQIYLGIGPTTSAGTISAGKFTVAALPAGVEGATAYATNGLKTGETPGAGTGVPVYYSANGPGGAGWYTFKDTIVSA